MADAADLKSDFANAKLPGNPRETNFEPVTNCADFVTTRPLATLVMPVTPLTRACDPRCRTGCGTCGESGLRKWLPRSDF